MASNYPGNIDDSSTLPSPTNANFLDNPNHAVLHVNENDAIKALETKVGKTASTPVLNYLLTGTANGSSTWQPAPVSAVWGLITGTLANQTDLQTSLNSLDSRITALTLGTNSIIVQETPTGTVNGSNTLFTTLQGKYIASSLEIFINGLQQIKTTDYTETNPTIGTFTFVTAPLTGDVVKVAYLSATGASGNADTVDGFHASSTPTANNIPVLNAQAKLTEVLLSGATLGRSNRTTTMSGFSVETDITSSSVTVPPTTRDIEVEMMIPQVTSSVVGDRFNVRLYEGATVIQQFYIGIPTNGWGGTLKFSKAAPAAGSVTYKATIARDSGTGTLTVYADATSILQLTVKLV